MSISATAQQGVDEPNALPFVMMPFTSVESVLPARASTDEQGACADVLCSKTMISADRGRRDGSSQAATRCAERACSGGGTFVAVAARLAASLLRLGHAGGLVTQLQARDHGT